MIKNFTISPEKALSRAQTICAKQERCSNDIHLKLVQWQIAPNEADKIINKLISDGFINDERYSRMFVRDKNKFNKWGPIKITYTLRSKRISEDIIKSALQEIISDDNTALKDLLIRKCKNIKAKTPYDLKVKLIRFGVSRGYEYEVVNKIVSSIVKEH